MVRAFMPMGQEFFHRSFIIIFVVLMGIRAYYHRQSIKYGGKAEFREKRFMRIVFAVPLVYFMVRYMISPSYLAWGDMAFPISLQWSGLGLGVLSIVLTIWIHVHLGKNFSSLLHVR